MSISLLVHIIILLTALEPNLLGFVLVTGSMAVLLPLIYLTITYTVDKAKPVLEFDKPVYDPSNNSLCIQFHFTNKAIILWKGLITIICNDQTVVQNAKFDFSAAESGLIRRDLKFPLANDAFLAENNTVKSFNVEVEFLSLKSYLAHTKYHFSLSIFNKFDRSDLEIINGFNLSFPWLNVALLQTGNIYKIILSSH